MSGEGNLPEGWAVAKLGEIADVQLGKMLDREKRTKGTKLTYLRNANVRWGFFDLSSLLEMPFEDDELGRYSVRDEDLMICEGGEPGRAAVWRDGTKQIKYQKALLRVRPSAGISPDWLLYSLRHDALAGNLEQHFTGSTIKHFPRQAVLNYDVALPPVVEQKRIVVKVEELLARVNAARARLARVPAILKRSRRAILAAACDGRLSEDWREPQQARLHSGLSAEELVQRARDFVGRQALVRRQRMLEEPPPNSPDADCPETWRVVRLRNVAVVLSGHTPKGIDQVVERRGRYPWFKVSDMTAIGNERFMEVIAHWLTEAAAAKVGIRPIPAGAIVFPKRGGAIATNKKRMLAQASCVDLNTMAVVPLPEIGPFIWWWLHSVDLGQLADGSNVPQINHPDIEELSLALPPEAEQREIVRCVEALFTLADAIEKRVAVATVRTDKLTQAILAKAFRGELVPTEAELARREGRGYETAGVLFQRIQGERVGADQGCDGRRGRALGAGAVSKRSGVRKGA